MNYQAHYNRLIERARDRVLEGYVERHHVIPKCMGGGNENENLVQLTPEEHFVAHQLLHKMNPEDANLKYAMYSMTTDRYGYRNGSNKLYGWIRRKWCEQVSKDSLERWKDPEFREKNRASMEAFYADPERSREAREAVSKAHKGRVKSEQERLNIAEAGRNRETRVFSDKARANMAVAAKKRWADGVMNGVGQKTRATRIANGSYIPSEETKAKMSASFKGRVPWNKGKTGVSEETSRKMSASAIARGWPKK